MQIQRNLTTPEPSEHLERCVKWSMIGDVEYLLQKMRVIVLMMNLMEAEEHITPTLKSLHLVCGSLETIKASPKPCRDIILLTCLQKVRAIPSVMAMDLYILSVSDTKMMNTDELCLEADEGMLISRKFLLDNIFSFLVLLHCRQYLMTLKTWIFKNCSL
jgi:hypothetical protein